MSLEGLIQSSKVGFYQKQRFTSFVFVML